MNGTLSTRARRELSLLDSLDRAVAVAADQPATVDADGHVRTWLEVQHRSSALAGGFLELGLHQGDRLAVDLPNSPELLECFYACAMAGLVIAPLNSRLSSEEQARYLRLIDPAALLATDSLAIDESSATRWVQATAQVRLLANQERIVSLADLLSGAPLQSPARPQGDTAVALFATSGTTGAPRAVLHTHRSLASTSHHMQMAVGYSTADRYLHAAPMFHVADCQSLFAVTLMGGSHTFLPTFSARSFARLLDATRSTATFLVPTMVEMLLDDPDVQSADLSSWRLLCYGGARMPTETLRRLMRQLPCQPIQNYGMTEFSLATVLSADDHLRAVKDADRDVLLRSAGTPAPGVSVRIAQEGSDGVGEIQVAGPNTLACYWRDQAATLDAYTPDGWVRTGDLGRLDSGYLYILDRRKDMIIVGGENVYSAEVEDVLRRHPAVSDAAVIGLPDPVWGERVHAVIVAAEADGRGCDVSELDTHARRWLAAYKVPRSYEAVASLPMTGTGKINKSLLRDAARGPTRDEVGEPRLASAVRSIAALPPGQQEAALVKFVLTRVAIVLDHLAPPAITPDSSLGDLGFTSLALLELHDRLTRDTGLTVPAALVFTAPTVVAVAEQLRSLISAASIITGSGGWASAHEDRAQE